MAVLVHVNYGPALLRSSFFSSHTTVLVRNDQAAPTAAQELACLIEI